MKIFMIDTMITRKAKEIQKLPNYDTYDYFTEQYKWLDQVRTQNKHQIPNSISDWLNPRDKLEKC